MRKQDGFTLIELLVVIAIIAFCINRHGGFINTMFMDWSVRKIGIKELWTLKWHPDFNTGDSWTKSGNVLPDDRPLWIRRFKDY